MHLPLTAHRHLDPFTQGVDNGHTDAMQTAGHLVAASTELAAGMEHGEHRFQGALTGARVNIRGNATTVVADGCGTVLAEGHQDPVAMARQGLVHRVVHHLIHKVVQSTRPRGADVHAWALADRLQALQHLNLLSAVGVLDLGSVAHAEITKPGNRVLGSRNGSEP